MEHVGVDPSKNPALTLVQFIARYLLLSVTVVPLAITSPIWLPFVLVGFLTEVVFIPGEWRFQRRMRAKGRYLSPRELKSRLAANASGTLIVDAPTLGWRITRVWWIEENVLSTAPVEPPVLEDRRVVPDRFQELPEEFLTWHPLNRWCWHQYLSPETGHDSLVAVWHGRKLAVSLAEGYPQVILLESSSAGRFLDKNERAKRKSELIDEQSLWDNEIDG